MTNSHDQIRRPDASSRLRLIADLKPAGNRIGHDRHAKLTGLVQSIKQSCFTSPVFTSGDVVINGHLRLEAMRLLGETLIPTIDLSHFRVVDFRALKIALDLIGDCGQWDLPRLRAEVFEITRTEPRGELFLFA